MDRQCINDVLRKADVMLCPSREDPMPTVCAEAMMHSVPCILSDATGTAAYVEDGISGLVFQSENAQELSEKMKWCMSHRKQVRKWERNPERYMRRIFQWIYLRRIFWRL